jgi:hypothetical protein
MLFPVAFGMLFAIVGCKPGSISLFQPDAKTMTAEQFADDPALKRLADAVERGDEPAIVAAVQAGDDVNAYGAGGFRLLYWALARENATGFEQLLKYGAKLDVDCRDPASLRNRSQQHYLPMLVISNPDQRFLKSALRHGLAPDFTPHEVEKRSLLFFAVCSHSHAAIETLLAAGANIDWQDHSGYTPLVEARMGRNYNTAWFLLERGADPTVADKQGHDFVWGLKEYGSRGVRPDHRESFEKIVTELIRRGLLTRQDIVEADKPKSPNSGITVIEHSPDSEAGRAILELDRREREANARDWAE